MSGKQDLTAEVAALREEIANLRTALAGQPACHGCHHHTCVHPWPHTYPAVTWYSSNYSIGAAGGAGTSYTISA